LGARHRSLYDERISEFRRLAAKQQRQALFANLGIAAVLATTLLLVGWLTLRGSVTLSAAGIAMAGVTIVGQRLTMAGYSAGTLAETARYVDDYLGFAELQAQVRESKRHDPAPSSFAEMSVGSVSRIQRLLDQRFATSHSAFVWVEIVALVGESGSGKPRSQTLGRALSAGNGHHHVEWY
jgi:ABC-type multidrug transport system fused ATPase/permease subunit